MLATILSLSSFFCLVNSCPSGWYQSVIDVKKCYYISLVQRTWPDAENYCRSLGSSHLTSILSAFENSQISTIAANNPAIGTLDQVWIGAHGVESDVSFSWVDGNPFVFTYWLAGQPSLWYPCVSTLARSSGRWRTEPCETKNHFICEYSPQPTTTPTDCFDWHFRNENSTNGIYQIYPPGVAPFNVYCDMVTDNGGWTVFHKRIDNSTEFWNGTYSEYQTGFGSLDKNFWMGLDTLHFLSTKDSTVNLRIDFYGTRCPELKCNLPIDGYWWTTVGFQVQDNATEYTIQFDKNIAGNIYVPFQSVEFNGSKFQTFDHGENLSCQRDNHFDLGPMWNGCVNWFFPNGRYDAPAEGEYSGFCINTIIDGFEYYIYPVGLQMKLRKSP